MHALLSITMAIAPLGQADPGTIAVVGDDLAVVVFPLAAGTAYELSYATSRESLWFDRGLTRPAAPLTTYAATNKGDFNGSGIVDGGDLQAFVTALIAGPYDVRGDFDDSGQIDATDAGSFVEYALGGYPVGAVLYVEGQAPSSALGDGQIDLLINSSVSQSRPVTVVDVTVNPTTIAVGDVVTIQMTPAIAPLAFGPVTTAQWSGQIQPMVGAVVGPLSVNFSPSQFRESGSGQAAVVIGDGAQVGSLDVSRTELPVTFVGTLSLHMGAIAVRKRVNFVPTGNAFAIHTIEYDNDSVPHVGPVPDGLEIYDTTEGNAADPIILSGSVGNYLTVVMRVSRNAITDASGPAIVRVDLVSRGVSGQDLQWARGLVLERDESASDPNTIIYHSSFDRPIILVDAPLNPFNHPEVIVILAEDGGEVSVMPEG